MQTLNYSTDLRNMGHRDPLYRQVERCVEGDSGVTNVVSIQPGEKRYFVRIHSAPGQSDGDYWVSCQDALDCFDKDGSFNHDRFRSRTGLVRQFGRADPQKDLKYVSIVEVDSNAPPFLMQTSGQQQRANVFGRTVEDLPGGATEFIRLKDDKSWKSIHDDTPLALSDPRTRALLEEGARLERNSSLVVDGPYPVMDGDKLNPTLEQKLNLKERSSAYAAEQRRATDKETQEQLGYRAELTSSGWGRKRTPDREK